MSPSKLLRHFRHTAQMGDFARAHSILLRLQRDFPDSESTKHALEMWETREFIDRNSPPSSLDGIVRQSISYVEINVLETGNNVTGITFSGALDIDPENLSILCFFNRDEHLAKACAAGLTHRIDEEIRKALSRNGYPESAIKSVKIYYSTDERVQKEAKGDYRVYLQ